MVVPQATMGCLYGGILAFCLILPSVTDNIDSDSVFNMVQERLNRSLMVCQDKYEAARLQKKNDAMNDFVSCADQSIQENIKTLPHLANKLKASFGIRDNGSSQLVESFLHYFFFLFKREGKRHNFALRESIDLFGCILSGLIIYEKLMYAFLNLHTLSLLLNLPILFPISFIFFLN